MKKSSILTLLLAAFGSFIQAKVLHVDGSRPASGPQNGASWSTAYSNVQTAIDSSKAGDSIWVAKGTYTHYYNATAFAMKDSVKIFGGFLNTHTKFSDRDWTRNSSILRGNGYMVILNSFLEAVGPEAVLDGFIVSGGVKGGMENSFSSPTVSNCTFISNSNSNVGGAGAMQNSACSSRITNCRFINNTGNCAVANADFGAFAPQSNTGPTFADCVFSGNIGVNSGGVSSSGCIVSFSNCDFTGNKSSVYGGGMSGYQALINLSDCRFTNNESSQEGGGLYLDKCVSAITRCSFTANKSDFGGGISNVSDTSIRYMTLSHCTFDGNEVTRAKGTWTYASTDRRGGGLHNRGRAMISDCTFRNNIAGYTSFGAAGGGIYCVFKPTDPVSTISNCRFYGNQATISGGYYWWGTMAHGGGAFIANGNLSNCVFENNEGVMYGGGLYVYGNGRSGIVNACQFSGNRSQFGGGIFGSSTVRIANSLLANNVADSAGGGIRYDTYQGYEGNFSGNTIAGNWSRRGGAMSLFAYSPVASQVKISNSVMWGNSSGIDKLTAIPAPVVTYSLVQGMAADVTNHVISGSTDPGFADTAGQNYQLLASSPCLDMGRNDSLSATFSTDVLGKARIYNTTVDMGAHEYGIYPPVAVLGADTTLCSNIRLRLRIPYQSGSTILWNTGDTSVSVNVTKPGRYYVTVTNVHGIASDTMNITHLAAPVLNLGNDTGVCDRMWLDAQNPGATYRWSSGHVTQKVQARPGTYSVVVTDSNLCRATDTIKIAQLIMPVVDLGPDRTIDEGESLILDARNTGSSFRWSTGETTRRITVDTAGIYSVVVTSQHGCVASGKVQVFVIPAPVGVKTVTSEAQMLSLHPNPASDMIQIRVNDPAMLRTKLLLTDATGRTVRTLLLEHNGQQLSLEGLAPGVYLLRSGNTHCWKIVKQ